MTSHPQQGSRRARPAVPRRMLLLSAAVLAAAVVARRRRTRPAVAPTLPADDLPHDGLQAPQSQAVLLSGGPSDGAYLSVAWGVRQLSIQDEERKDHHYREASGTEVGPAGEPVRVFLHSPD